VEVVLIDVTQPVNVFEIRHIAAQWPDVSLVALGLQEQKQEVIRAGRAGFAGYISRDASIDTLCQALRDVATGRLAIPPEIAGGLLRALFQHEQTLSPDPTVGLTRRESEVLDLLGQGLSNKEIGNELCLSVATVKHHVHHVLEKLRLPGRAQAMRKVRDTPWLAQTSSVGRK
jgi:DNA-binding NarL/FixJ family response regulator